MLRKIPGNGSTLSLLPITASRDILAVGSDGKVCRMFSILSLLIALPKIGLWTGADSFGYDGIICVCENSSTHILNCDAAFTKGKIAT